MANVLIFARPEFLTDVDEYGKHVLAEVSFQKSVSSSWVGFCKNHIQYSRLAVSLVSVSLS